jgi:hypothetical protein
MISLLSSMMPLIASHGTAARRLAQEFEDLLEALDLPWVCSRWVSTAALSSSDSAFFAIFGSAFRICFSA